MRKHFLILMLMTLLPLAGWAQGILAPNSYFKNGNFVYQVITTPEANGAAGTARLVGVREGYNPVDADNKLNLDGHFTIVVLEDNYTLDVIEATATALKNNYDIVAGVLTAKGEFAGRTSAKTVVIPKQYTTIKAGTFEGYTNLASISFEADAEVTTIETGAFTTTQISNFDFTNCAKLTTIQAGLFVETIGGTKQTNSYITTISLPIGSSVLTTIGTAFQNLPNLEALNNLDQTKITTIEAKAFENDAKLKTLALPSTVQTIAEGAFEGSGVEDLTIDVTSLNDVTACATGNVYSTVAYLATVNDYKTLKKLTLKGVLAGEFKSKAFKNCTSLATLDMTNLTINGGKIGDNAFEACTSLATLAFNDITEGTIGTEAFKGCTALTSVEFKDIAGTEIKDALIDDNAFAGCLKLGTIKFGNLTHVTIDNSAFALAAAPTATATELTFGELTDVDINASAFAGFTKMNKIEFGKTDGVNIATLAFANCTSGLAATATATLEFKTSMKNVIIAGGATTTGAFYNTANLSSIKFAASENLTIQTYAFENTAKAGLAASLNFGDAKNIIIGDYAFSGMTKAETITFGNIEDDAVPSVELAANAFAGATNLMSLTFGDLKDVTIKGNAFLDASSALTSTDFAEATFGDLKGTTIEDGAFAGATRLATVTIGDVTNNSVIGTTTTPTGVFPALHTATIGTINGNDNVIGVKAFTFGNYTGAKMNLASESGEFLQHVSGAAQLIAADAVDFVNTTGVGFTSFTAPVVNIGEIKTADALAAGALKGSTISTINFKGDIAANGLNNMIIVDNAGVAAALELNTLVFDGAIAAHGIKANAFANLPAVMTITFNGKLAADAVDAGAFEKLAANSHVKYDYDEDDIVLTASPFAKRVFDNTSDITGAADIAAIDAILPRVIQLSITNEALKAKFFEATPSAGLGTDGAFDIYRVIVVMPTPPVPADWSIIAYQNQANEPNVAWARWEFGAKALNETVAPGKEITIQRVQNSYKTSDPDAAAVTGTIRVTLYGTYTEEDDFNQKSSIYMVPLKAVDGKYVIPGTNCETLIARVELKSGNFQTNNNDGIVKVAVTQTNTSNSSIWGQLKNTELFCASNIMTNQQLIDKTAVDAATDIATMKGVAGSDNAGDYLAEATALDASGIFHSERNCSTIGGVNIYRSTSVGSDDSKVAESLYRMRDPKALRGFEIVKDEIQKGGAYIGTGVYYMLLKKYENAPAYAHVVWLDDDQATGIFGVKSDVNNIATVNNAVYTLQGIRVNQLQKGQLYIMNGKKFIAK